VIIAGSLGRPCLAASFFVEWAAEVTLILRARRRLLAALWR
jgi:hypothetical protein